MKLHHIGIVVKSISETGRMYKELFGFEFLTDIIMDKIQKVKVAFISTKNPDSILIELIEPASHDSPVVNYLEKRIGMYHCCYEVENIQQMTDELRKKGALIICEPVSAEAFNGKKIAFVYLKDETLIEFLEKDKNNKATNYKEEIKNDEETKNLLMTAEKELSIKNIISIAQQFKNINLTEVDYPKIRIAFLTSFTIEPLIPFFEAECYKLKLVPEIYVAGYNQYQQQILNYESELYKFNPEILILAVRQQELCPKLVDSFLELSSEEINNEISNVLNTFQSLLDTFRKNSNARVIVHNFDIPAFPAVGILDYQYEMGQENTFRKINERLVEILKKHRDIYLFDYNRLTSLVGKLNWHDERLWFLAKAPISGKNLIYLAKEYMRFIKPMKGLNRKCLVLDLDNTLWGGILEEDGIEGIKLGFNFPGNIFLNFQKEILKLYSKGIILAINSRNIQEDVIGVLERHPYMLLRKKHFSAMRINSQSKDQNMKELADELNIGLDSLVFFDDNPIERELIKQSLPEVLTVDVPEDPSLFSDTLKSLSDFEILNFCEEDKRKGQLYQTQIARKELMQKSKSIEDFYRSLKMKVDIRLADKFAIPRLSQMTQKTNQFNLTTKRYSENEISSFYNSKDSRVYYLRLIDKFSDNGIVSLIIIKINGTIWEIDTFLMSCRVLQRTIEDAFMAFIFDEAKKNNVKYLIGRYILTKKNCLVKNLYKKYGFKCVSQSNNEAIWRLEVKKVNLKKPDWITVFSN